MTLWEMMGGPQIMLIAYVGLGLLVINMFRTILYSRVRVRRVVIHRGTVAHRSRITRIETLDSDNNVIAVHVLRRRGEIAINRNGPRQRRMGSIYKT